MPEPRHTYSAWRKSSRSGANNGNCVEVGFDTEANMTGIRDTKDRTYGTLEVSGAVWSKFLDAVRHGDLSA